MQRIWETFHLVLQVSRRVVDVCKHVVKKEKQLILRWFSQPFSHMVWIVALMPFYHWLDPELAKVWKVPLVLVLQAIKFIEHITLRMFNSNSWSVRRCAKVETDGSCHFFFVKGVKTFYDNTISDTTRTVWKTHQTPALGSECFGELKRVQSLFPWRPLLSVINHQALFSHRSL